MQTHAADQTGELVAFGGVTDKIGRLIDDEQIGIFVDDFKESRHAATTLRIENRNLEIGKLQIEGGGVATPCPAGRVVWSMEHGPSPPVWI